MFYLVFDTETNGLPIRKDKNEDFSNVYLYQLAYYKYDKNLNLNYNSNIKIKSKHSIELLKQYGFEWPIIDKNYI